MRTRTVILSGNVHCGSHWPPGRFNREGTHTPRREHHAHPLLVHESHSVLVRQGLLVEARGTTGVSARWFRSRYVVLAEVGIAPTASISNRSSSGPARVISCAVRNPREHAPSCLGENNGAGKRSDTQKKKKRARHLAYGEMQHADAMRAHTELAGDDGREAPLVYRHAWADAPD